MSLMRMGNMEHMARYYTKAKCRQKGDTVILKVDDDTEIVLTKVSDLSTQDAETS